MQGDAENEARERIVLIGAEESYWLLKGEDYLSAMLSAEGFYPTPVLYFEYDSMYELNMDLEEGVLLSSLWGIHPGIIGRLRREDHIKEERK
jgi:hypothetical protein